MAALFLKKKALLLITLLLIPTLGGTHAFAAKLIISPAQQLLLEASQFVSKKDFASAEQIYSQIISSDGGNIDAYLQRAVVRREMDNHQGSKRDATMVTRLANATLQRDPDDAESFYHRGKAHRLLYNFEQAKKDIITAIKLSGKNRWRTELQAIALEEKIYGAQ